MSTEEVRIIVKRYRTQEGRPACLVRGEGSCKFLSLKMDCSAYCCYDGVEPIWGSGDNGTGHLMPKDDCPLWNKK